MIARKKRLVLAKDALLENLREDVADLCPVTDRRFLKLVEEVFTPFISLVSSQDDARFDVLMGDFRFVVFLCQHLHMRELNQSCSSRGIELILDASQKKIMNPAWDGIGSEFSDWLIDRSRAQQWLSVIRSNVLTFGSPRGIGNLVSGKLQWALGLGQGERLRTDYSLRRSVKAVQYEPWLYLKRPTLSECSVKNWKSDFVEPYLDLLSSDLTRTLGEQGRRQLASAWAKRLSEVESIYRTFVDARKRFSLLLVNGGTNPFRKIMMLAYQRSGVETILFHHGHDFGGRIQKYGHLGEVSHARRFICPTEWIANNYQRAYQREIVEQRTGTVYESVGSNYFNEIYEKSKLTRKEELQSRAPLMLIGRPINDRRLLDASGGFLVYKIALEVKLIQLLQRSGHEVIYKAHPESAVYAEALFGSQCKVSTTRLEEIYNEAGCLIFTTATSTAFGFAMATTVPILLIEHKDNLWQEHVKRKILTRCAIIEYAEPDGAVVTPSLEFLHDSIEEAKHKASDSDFLSQLTEKRRLDPQ